MAYQGIYFNSFLFVFKFLCYFIYSCLYLSVSNQICICTLQIYKKSIKLFNFSTWVKFCLSVGRCHRRRATLLLPSWICSCQSVGTVNFILPFTTNVTISISILQTFRSWVATSHLRPPMAFLSHNLSDTPGLAPLMNVLFWGRYDFLISFSGRDMSRNVWNRL